MYRPGDGDALSAERVDHLDFCIKLLERFRRENDLQKRVALFEAFRVI
jgi:hypothetical protein